MMEMNDRGGGAKLIEEVNDHSKLGGSYDSTHGELVVEQSVV